MIASPEKALCDQLYTISPCANRVELKQLLYEDLRIDPQALTGLRMDDMIELAGLYNTRNHRLLASLAKEMKRNEQHH